MLIYEGAHICAFSAHSHMSSGEQLRSDTAIDASITADDATECQREIEERKTNRRQTTMRQAACSGCGPLICECDNWECEENSETVRLSCTAHSRAERTGRQSLEAGSMVRREELLLLLLLLMMLRRQRGEGRRGGRGGLQAV